MNGPPNLARTSDPWRAFAISVLLASVFVIDLLTPLGVAEWVLYQVPSVLALSAVRPTLPLATAAVATGLVLAGFFFSPSGADPVVALTNRAGGVIAVWALVIADRQLLRARLSMVPRPARWAYRPWPTSWGAWLRSRWTRGAPPQ